MSNCRLDTLFIVYLRLAFARTMSLPPLLKFIYNHGTEEVIRRGKKIFHSAGVQFLDVDHVVEQIRFRVRNDLYHNYYTVTVSKYLQEKKLSVRCQCPYNLSDICRHEVAALYQLNEFIQTGFFENDNLEFDQSHTVLRMRQVSRDMLRVFSNETILSQAETWAKEGVVKIVLESGNKLEARVTPTGEPAYPVTICQNEEKYFDTSCTCQEKNYPLCVHKAAVFLHIILTKGIRYFQTLYNWDEQKNKLLSLYGYSTADDLTGKFTFTYENGKPFLRVLDPSIKKINQAEKREVATVEVVEKEWEEPAPQQRIGILIDCHTSWYPFGNISLLSGIPDNNHEDRLENPHLLELGRYINANQFVPEDRDIIPAARKCLHEEILRYIRKSYPFAQHLSEVKIFHERPEAYLRGLIWEYLLPKYHRLLSQFENHPFVYLKRKDQDVSLEQLETVTLSPKKIYPQLYIKPQGENIRIALEWKLDKATIPFEHVERLNEGLMLYDGQVFTIAGLQELQFIENIPNSGYLDVPTEEWPDFLEKNVIAWLKFIQVDWDSSMISEITDTEPAYQLYLREKDTTLILQPAFVYASEVVQWDSQTRDIIIPENGKIRIIRRNIAAENKLIEHLKVLHTDMQMHSNEYFFSIPAKVVLSHNWFFRFLEDMKEWEVALFGFEQLKNLKINTHKPTVRMQVESGIDWFDTALDIHFGDQQVKLEDLKKALTDKQHYIRLDDGSIGILPEQWIKKYTLLFKLGKTGQGKVRVKKFHFSVIDLLLEERDEVDILAELEEKKQLLAGAIDQDYSEIEPPSGLQATLRPYQLAGFRWLTFLASSGWGGLLADDMGLGKTVQTLACLQHYKNKQGSISCLVVCPTTLIYNWENEIKKFTPEFTYHIHHGPKRKVSNSIFDQIDIVITTYGTMRSDIKKIREFEFDYVILDESQAIKNPQSQASKAALLLQAKHRIALSGTPLQNNTFDLYAQMNFLNPGILGSREFFMNEFATPIDKFQEEDVKKELRKITYPFLLRRTKEQVAKDLPEKTETVLYCEMGKEQRVIYEAYRNSYKSKILDMIDEQGMEKSRLHILQGLTRLRQICDSPAILKDDSNYENHSVKLDELVREIQENIQSHKALIFSQFLGMLSLIAEKLEQLKIPFVYFDGSTQASEREKAIKEFQQNDNCRIFLISLKAGGIGLNLTAADYVYIVDPWWNPAVEQQAIDRTHRIGQKRNIFAYRLICRNTIEEKMLILQARKKALAQELVGEDSAILKRLTREDIDFLFS